MFARLTACALLSLTAVFSAAQEIRVERVSFSAPVAGAAAAVPLGAPSLSAPRLSLSANPILRAAPFTPLHEGAPSAELAAAAPAAAAEANQAIAAAAASAASAIPAPASASASKETAPTLEGALVPAAAETHAAPAKDAPNASESDRDSASRDFSALLGERLVEGRGDVDSPTAFPAEDETSAASSSRLGAPSRARWLTASPAVLAAALPAIHPNGAQWHVLSKAGYIAGNVGAAIFPLVQIYQSLHGKSTPKSRAIIGAVASLALGLICAPILHKTLWGIQNLFGGVTLFVPLFINAIKGTVSGSPLKATAIISAAALAVSVAAYFAAAATVPALLGALFTAAAISKIATVAQFATSAMFLWMFLPDTVKVLRGKASGGFSPGFNLMFFLSAVGCMIWAVPSAWIYSGADQSTYRLIFAVNSIYALASFVSFWFARREAKP